MAIDLTRLSPEQLDKFLHMQSIVWRQKEEQARIRALRAYYDGEHPVMLTDRQAEFLGPMLTEGEFEFAHNAIKSVIDTLRERLSVSGFTVNGAGLGGDEDNANAPETVLANTMWGWWEDNRYDAQQIRLHRRTLRDGKSYVMVSWDNDNQRPKFTLHSADDGTTGITCHRDPENPENILFFCKYWYTYNPLKPGETGDQRKTVYLPHEIRKYQMGKDGFWQRSPDPGDVAWPIPWVDSDGEPLGHTIFEFENPGGSEIAQIIGLQNALNKSWLDLLAAADAAGFPIIAIEYDNKDGGFGTVTDDNDIDDDDEFVIAPGRALEVDGARVHRLEGANLEQLIKTIQLTVETIAGITRTPAHYFRPVGGSDVPSGEALKQLESGLVARAEERQLIFGQSWADVMTMAYKVARTFGSSVTEVAKLKVETTWDEAATREELQAAQEAQILLSLEVPVEEIWARLGFSPEKIAGWRATRQSDEAVRIASVADAVLSRQAQQNGANVNGAQPQPVNVANVNGNGGQG